MGSILTPAALSTVGAIYGLDKKGPIIGRDLKKLTMTEKKSPNNDTMPKLSRANPINDLFANIKMIPPTKHINPFVLLRRVKNTTVL